jgi:hypothetical protein
MVLPLKIDVLPEPELEFANAARDVDPAAASPPMGPPMTADCGRSASDWSGSRRTLRPRKSGLPVSTVLRPPARAIRLVFATGRD